VWRLLEAGQYTPRLGTSQVQPHTFTPQAPHLWDVTQVAMSQWGQAAMGGLRFQEQSRELIAFVAIMTDTTDRHPPPALCCLTIFQCQARQSITAPFPRPWPSSA